MDATGPGSSPLHHCVTVDHDDRGGVELMTDLEWNEIVKANEAMQLEFVFVMLDVALGKDDDE